MPVYEYLCSDCGYFEQLRPMAQSQENCDCPFCGEQSKRVMSAPRLSILPAHQRKAHEVNERSRHEPKVGGKAGCCAHGTCSNHRASAGSEGNSRAAASAAPSNGASADESPRYKAQKGPRRPWMISH